MSGAAPSPSGGHRIPAPLLVISDATAAILLVADLLVVCGSVLLRFLFNAPVEWADDVARGLMVGSSFFGAASALARSENLGVSVLHRQAARGHQARDQFHRRAARGRGRRLRGIQRPETRMANHRPDLRLRLAAGTDVLSDGRRRAVHDDLCDRAFLRASRSRHDRRRSRGRLDRWPLSGVGFPKPGFGAVADGADAVWLLVALVGGLPIGFALAFAALIFIWVEGALPGLIFAQQMARGIDNFVLLAIPFFILVGYLMEANGMSVRLIALLQRLLVRCSAG